MTFFGLNRLQIFNEIDEILYYCNGYDWYTLYNFPIWLRKFTKNKLIERLKPKEDESVITNTTDLSTLKNLPKPDVRSVTYKK